MSQKKLTHAGKFLHAKVYRPESFVFLCLRLLGNLSTLFSRWKWTVDCCWWNSLQMQEKAWSGSLFHFWLLWWWRQKSCSLDSIAVSIFVAILVEFDKYETSRHVYCSPVSNGKPISIFETRTRRFFFQSRVLRQELEFFNFSLGLRYNTENRDKDNFHEKFWEGPFLLLSTLTSKKRLLIS